MKRAAWLFVALFAVAVQARTQFDMRDPKRAVGTDDGIRVDAELVNDVVSPGAPIRITYRIENLTQRPVGVVERRGDVTFDDDSRTMMLSVGSEIPNGGEMPHLIVVKPGETKTLTTAATFRGVFVPRFVQIVVNVLRDAVSFLGIHERQRLDDTQFNRWLETNDSIVLNAIPVHYRPEVASRTDASRH